MTDTECEIAQPRIGEMSHMQTIEQQHRAGVERELESIIADPDSNMAAKLASLYRRCVDVSVERDLLGLDMGYWKGDARILRGLLREALHIHALGYSPEWSRRAQAAVDKPDNSQQHALRQGQAGSRQRRLDRWPGARSADAMTTPLPTRKIAEAKPEYKT